MKALLNTLIAWGPLGVFIVAVVDGAGMPSPGGLDWMVLLLSINQPGLAFGFAGLAILGSLIGGLFLFWLARRGGEKMLAKYRGRPRFEKLEKWFQHYGLLTVFIPALIPIPMPLKFFIVCAGVFDVSPMSYFLVLTVARIPRYLALAYLGSQLGHESFNWMKAHAWHMIGAAAALFVLLYLTILVVDRRKRLTGQE